ncbi:MAG TPA: glycosyltransferase [Nocardioides sp.]|nr:glycosyltransferase [Nocardioides sp.]
MLHIVIPAYNEELRLPRTLRELRRHVAAARGVLGRVEVIVVDNASTDATADVARAADSAALPVRVVRCTRRGKGAAVRAGILASDADLVCFMDADGATRLDALELAWQRMQLGADVVIGSRALEASDTEARHCRSRSAGAAAYRRLARRLVPGVADTQCGFKMFDGNLARRAAELLETAGFAFDVELLVLMRAAGARIEEIPVTWVDVPGSTFVPARHGAAAFAELARIAWRHRELVRPEPIRLPVPAALPAGLAAVVVPLVVSADRGTESAR